MERAVGSLNQTVPFSTCIDLQDRFDETILRYDTAPHIYNQMIHQDRLGAIAIVSAILKCRTVLYP